MTIKQALEKIFKENPEMTGYRLSKLLGCEPSTIYRLQKTEAKIHARIALNIYNVFGIVVSPFTKVELEALKAKGEE